MILDDIPNEDNNNEWGGRLRKILYSNDVTDEAVLRELPKGVPMPRSGTIRIYEDDGYLFAEGIHKGKKFLDSLFSNPFNPQTKEWDAWECSPLHPMYSQIDENTGGDYDDKGPKPEDLDRWDDLTEYGDAA